MVTESSYGPMRSPKPAESASAETFSHREPSGHLFEHGHLMRLSSGLHVAELQGALSVVEGSRAARNSVQSNNRGVPPGRAAADRAGHAQRNDRGTCAMNARFHRHALQLGPLRMVEWELRIEGPDFEMSIDDQPLRLSSGYACRDCQKLPPATSKHGRTIS